MNKNMKDFERNLKDAKKKMLEVMKRFFIVYVVSDYKFEWLENWIFYLGWLMANWRYIKELAIGTAVLDDANWYKSAYLQEHDEYYLLMS